MIYELPMLPYAYDALEPHFDTETMMIHHQRHHQAYIDNLNKAIAATEVESKGLEALLRETSKHSAVIRNNAGGHYNHSLFWNILSPDPAIGPSGLLQAAIQASYGTLDNLKSEIDQAAISQFGSGWAWLLVKYNGTLAVSASANQDNPLMDTTITNQGYPILGVDVWEHAYYLNYRNKRADYLKAFWSVLDWSAVESNYGKALEKLHL